MRNNLESVSTARHRRWLGRYSLNGSDEMARHVRISFPGGEIWKDCEIDGKASNYLDIGNVDRRSAIGPSAPVHIHEW